MWGRVWFIFTYMQRVQLWIIAVHSCVWFTSYILNSLHSHTQQISFLYCFTLYKLLLLQSNEYNRVQYIKIYFSLACAIFPLPTLFGRFMIGQHHWFNIAGDLATSASWVCNIWVFYDGDDDDDVCCAVRSQWCTNPSYHRQYAQWLLLKSSIETMPTTGWYVLNRSVRIANSIISSVLGGCLSSQRRVYCFSQ